MKVKDKSADEQIHNGRRKKLRERFDKYGLESLNETEVLEFALGVAIPRIDTNPTAHRLINKFGSLDGVINAHPDKLKQVAGIGEQCAYFLSFLKQFVTYMMGLHKNNEKIKNPSDAVNYLKDTFSMFTSEQLILLCLDKAGTVLLQERIGGNLDKVDVDLRRIVDTALRVRGVAVILAHNHLSGNTAPSDADLRLTRELVNVLLPLGIDVMEHLIFSEKCDSFSFARNGTLDVFKREHRRFFKNSPE